MAIKFEKITAGMTLYDRHRSKMGNTSMSTLGEWPVYVVSVDAEGRTAVVRWNGNYPRTWHESRLRKLYDWSAYDECAVIVKDRAFGRWLSVRKKSKAEMAAAT